MYDRSGQIALGLLEDAYYRLGEDIITLLDGKELTDAAKATLRKFAERCMQQQEHLGISDDTSIS